MKYEVSNLLNVQIRILIELQVIISIVIIVTQLE